MSAQKAKVESKNKNVSIVRSSSKTKMVFIREANALSRMPWDVNSVWDLRLLLKTASMIGRNDEDFKEYKFNVRDVIVGSGRRYSDKIAEELHESLAHCQGTVLSWEQDGKLITTAPFADSKIDKATGDMIIHVSPRMKPFYLGLKDEFTELPLETVLCLPSVLTIKLYRFLMSWRNDPKGYCDATIGWLHELLGTKESYRRDFSLFRSRFLEPAQAQIESKTDLYYRMEPIWEGHKVVKVRFWFKLTQAEIEELHEVRKIQEEAELKQKAEACYANLRKKDLPCRPRQCIRKCQYCLTKGPKYTEIRSRTD